MHSVALEKVFQIIFNNPVFITYLLLCLCRTLLVAGGTSSDLVDGFLASLGNQLYTTDATVM